MKKIKIMMTAIAIMAVAGGALAFKARTYSDHFCIRALALGPGVCTNSYIGKISTNMGNIYYTTPTTNLNNCMLAHCPTSTRLTFMEE